MGLKQLLLMSRRVVNPELDRQAFTSATASTGNVVCTWRGGSHLAAFASSCRLHRPPNHLTYLPFSPQSPHHPWRRNVPSPHNPARSTISSPVPLRRHPSLAAVAARAEGRGLSRDDDATHLRSGYGLIRRRQSASTCPRMRKRLSFSPGGRRTGRVREGQKSDRIGKGSSSTSRSSRRSSSHRRRPHRRSLHPRRLR